MKQRQFFVAYDGEGIDGKYILLSDSHGGVLSSLRGLRTADVFEWFFKRQHELTTETMVPVFVGFATVYDFNMMLRDVDDDKLRLIFQTDEKDFVTWESDQLDRKAVPRETYQILCFPKKLMRIRRLSDSRTVTLYDTFTFFGKSFLKTAREFLGDIPELKLIERGKESRGAFTKKQLPFIKRYNRIECETLVRIMDSLREMFEKNSLDLRKWHGPGAVADFMLGKRGFNVHSDFPNYNDEDVPDSLSQAWDCAFYGGRIENTLVGSVKNVFCYDINSAYPKAASLLPQLTFARYWKRERVTPENASPMTCFLVQWNLDERCFIGPFPWRDRFGRIFFPLNGAAWIWQPEVLAARAVYGRKIRVLDAWTHPVEAPSKFSQFVPELYAKRLALKKAKDTSEYAVKISLNSMYGKLAQRVGQHPYQCLPFAGWITSYCRAQLFLAAQQAPRDVIAFATDSIFSRSKLNLPESSDLGAWKREHYKKILVLMSGFYVLEDETGKRIKFATRGVPSDLSWDDTIKQLNMHGVVRVKRRMFVTHNMALHFHKSYGPLRLQFTDVDAQGERLEKIIDPFSSSKRIFPTRKIGDWSNENVASFPIHVPNDEISNPSSLTFEPEFLEAMKQEKIEDEGEDEDVL